MTSTRSLQDWLTWQESLHLSAIDLGLDRVADVAGRMGLLSVPFPVITVAGTNGKGSTVAFLSSLLRVSGYKVGAYTSPHILRYNERVAVNGLAVDDDYLCAAFAAIDAARGEVSLTYFEFGTLAAIWVFVQEQVDAVVLEVGLGGRLDATNLWDADAAIITGIGIDHVDWLGDSREAIGREKAGIARAGKVLVCGDPEPPASIAAVAATRGARLLQNGVHFSVKIQGVDAFSVHMTDDTETSWLGLPRPALQGDIQLQNAACAMIALDQIRDLLPLGGRDAVEQGLRAAWLPGRLQKLRSRPDVWVDVAHNPHAAVALAGWLQKNPTVGKTYVLFSILADKDIGGVINVLLPQVDEWHFFPLVSPRATPVSVIQEALESAKVKRSVMHTDIRQAWTYIDHSAKPDDRVVIFGSFLVVSNMLDGIFQVS